MDLADYISDGLIGKYNTGSVDIYDHNWDSHWTTNRACKDAHMRAVQEFVISTYAHFVDYNSESPEPSHGINEFGKIRFCQAVNNVQDKYIEYIKWSSIFFNTLQYDNGDPETSDKIKVVGTYEAYFLYLNPELWGVFGDIGFTNGVLTTVTIDYPSYQTLNEEIYTNMITSFIDYLHALKNMIKVLTGTTFEEVKVK